MKIKDKIDVIGKIVGITSIVCGELFGLIKYREYHQEKKLERISNKIKFIEKYNSEPFVTYREHLNYVVLYGCTKSENPIILFSLEEIEFIPDPNDPNQFTRRSKVILSKDDKKRITERIGQCAEKEAIAVIEQIDLLKDCVDFGLCDKHMFIEEFRSRSNTLSYFLDDFIKGIRKIEGMNSFESGVFAARDPYFKQVTVDPDVRISQMRLRVLRKTSQ